MTTSLFASRNHWKARRTMGVLIALCALGLGDKANASEPTIRVWPGVAPGSEHATQKEVTYKNTPLGTVVINVTAPTLTAYLPKASAAIGTGVIIAPGGACVALAMDLEGASVARLFQRRGIAAFVLKYRTMEKRQEGIPDVDMDQACKPGMADGIEALKVIRRRAAQFHVSPDKVGFVGFSAGGMIASGAVLQSDLGARPNFAGFIYGAPFGAMPSIPASLPPLFMAWAQDDTQAAVPMSRFYQALRSAGSGPEVHIFGAGGHGFGTGKTGTTSAQWPEEFFSWLKMQKLL